MIGFRDLLASNVADAVIEIAPGWVTAMSMPAGALARSGSSMAVEALPEGAVVASLNDSNVREPETVAAAVRRATGTLGLRPRHVALVIPDLAAAVSLVTLARIPSRTDELERLIRWHVRRSVPFSPDEARVGYSAGQRAAGGGQTYVTVVSRRDVVREYESVCEEVGPRVGLVDVASFGVVNLALERHSTIEGDWLVVHLRPEYVSLTILRGEDLLFFRTRGGRDLDALVDGIHQSAMYFQDRLEGHELSRVFLTGTGATSDGFDRARRILDERLCVVVEPLNASTELAKSLEIALNGHGESLDGAIAGTLVRTQTEAVGV